MLIGIDPGKRGAAALVAQLPHGGFRVMSVEDMALKPTGPKKTQVDPAVLVDWIEECRKAYPVQAVVIERVFASPQMGTVSAFDFGTSFGMLLGIVASLRLRTELITPPVWKRAMRVPANKDAARGRASEVFPHDTHLWPRKKDDGRAEAALLAAHGFSLL